REVPAASASASVSAPAEGAAASAEAAPPRDPSNRRDLACGDFHTCALMPDSTVRCWGRGKSGELGDGAAQDRVQPTPVPGLRDVEQLALGASFSCALLRGGTVRCWGSGAILGDG